MNRVLIVDDKPENLYLLRMLLQGHGYAVDEARHGTEALDKARQTPPHLIIADLLMPVMDGYTLLRHWRADERLGSIPFVVYTATYTDVKDEQLALNLGADAFILKPAEPDEFMERIRQVLARTDRGRLPTGAPQEEDHGLFREYSEVLVRKLEDKTLELEQTNRALLADIAERKRAEAALSIRNNLYAMLSRTNQAVSRSRSRDELFREVCTIAVETGQFRFAWIGVPEADRMTLVASAGNDNGYMAEVVITLDEDDPASQGPTGQAARTGRSFVMNNVFTASPDTTGAASWREQARRAGFAASAAFPLTEHGAVVAVLTLYAAVPGFFTDDLVATLSEITPGLSFAIERFVQERDRRRDEAELRLRDRAIQAVSQGIIITDHSQPDGPIIFVSPGFERLTGYPAAEIIGSNCRFLQGRETDPAVVTQLRYAIREGRGCTVELLNYRKDGSSFWNSLTISPVLDPSGRVTHYVGVQIDVTERRQLENQFRQAQKMEAIGLLAGGVAHDFNNLLTVISGYSELLLDLPELTDSMRESVTAISDAGEMAASLTRQLLAFSRQSLLQPALLDLNAVVTEIGKLLHRLIGEDIELTTVLDANLSKVRVDPSQLNQVLMNLAVNARDAMPTGGKLTIETSNVELSDAYAAMHPGCTAGPHVMVAMTDSGCGMTPKILARIFDPFFTTKTVGKGTGLGLAMVFGIVQQSGGSIHVYSEPGHGSTFKIYFPAESEQQQPPRDPASAITLGGMETILLVEDDAGVRALALLSLQRHGFQVLTATDGADALRLVGERQGPIDLLLTDVVMPQMSGPELAGALRAQLPQLKVLFMSGYTDDAVVRHGLLHADMAFIQKPYTPLGLAQKIRQLLDATSAFDE